MPGLVPGIHDFLLDVVFKSWMAGTSPAMTSLAVYALRKAETEGAFCTPLTRHIETAI
jgi:hypothetical protein